jgi:hypothetical protein
VLQQQRWQALLQLPGPSTACWHTTPAHLQRQPWSLGWLALWPLLQGLQQQYLQQQQGHSTQLQLQV